MMISDHHVISDLGLYYFGSLKAQMTAYFFSNTVFLKDNSLFIWLGQVLVLACKIFSCSMWDLVP